MGSIGQRLTALESANPSGAAAWHRVILQAGQSLDAALDAYGRERIGGRDARKLSAAFLVGLVVADRSRADANLHDVREDQGTGEENPDDSGCGGCLAGPTGRGDR